MGVTSVNLSVTPFISSCDSTRANMASKQFSQSLTHPNCDVPYVINNEWRNLSNSSTMGIKFAPDSGTVIYNNDELMIVYYDSGNHEVFHISPIKATTSIYATSLRDSLPKGSKFEKGDVLYEYDAFKNGIPSSGYNVTTLYTPFFGYNHEDSLVISEDFAERAKHKYTEIIYIPICEYTLFSKIYKNHLEYFPEIGDQIQGEVVCSSLLPQSMRNQKNFNTNSIKSQVLDLLQTMNLSDLINMKISGGKHGFSTEKITSHIEDGIISGFKIHKINKNIKLIDSDLQNILDKLYKRYNFYILNSYNNLNNLVDENFAKKLLREYYIYADRDKIRKDVDLNDVVYLIELEISKETHVKLGDKLSTRHASKGVVSLILPNELRPYIQSTGEPVDFIYSPFGVFSRMNLSQVLELTCAKPTHTTDQLIKKDPKNICKYLSNLNESLIKYLGDLNYYDNINQLIKVMKHDKNCRENIINDICNNNLYIEVPSFTKIETRKLLQNVNPKANENVIIPKETVNYLKDKLGCFKNLIVNDDIIIPNAFVGMMYIQKLHKISEKLITYRDLGPLKYGSMQPERGRAAGGGSTLGQMEIESIISNGCETALTELLTVKNDWSEEKKKFLWDVISTGKYDLPDKIPENSSRTKSIVNSILHFLKN